MGVRARRIASLDKCSWSIVWVERKVKCRNNVDNTTFSSRLAKRWPNYRIEIIFDRKTNHLPIQLRDPLENGIK
jgi:hypothetical protein